MSARRDPVASPRRPAGMRDLLVAGAAVVVVFVAGLVLGIYDSAETILRSSAIADEVVGLVLLLLVAAAVLTVRRWRQATEDHQRWERAEARFRALVEESPAAAYTWDARAHRHLYVSPQIESVAGYTPEEWGDEDLWFSAIVDEDQASVREASRHADTGTQQHFIQEYRIRTKDGTVRWLHDESRNVAWNDDGRPAIAQGVITDITSLRAATERASEAEARFKTIVERVPAVAYVWDGADAPGTASAGYISPQIEALLGYPAQEWLEHPDAWGAYVHPEDLPGVLQAWNRAVGAGTAFSAEYRIRAADGRWRAVRDEANPVGVGERGKPIYQGVLFDVTERREAEVALRHAEERARSVLENLPVTAYMADYESVEPFTVYDRWISPGIVRLTGSTQEEWLARDDPWVECLHPEDRDATLDAWHSAVADGRTFEAEYRMIHRDGHEVWVREETSLEIEGTRIRADGVFVDITARRTAEAGRLAAEERFRSLVEEIPVAVYTDAVDELSTALYISPLYERITGYTAEERLADRGLWARILHPDDRERVLAESERTNVTGDPFDIEYRIVAADGRTVWLHDQARLVAGPDGSEVWQGILEDVTQRREAEQALHGATRRFQALVEQIPAITYMEDAATEREIYVSPQIETILGYTPQEWTATDAWEMAVHPDDRARVLAEDARATEDGDAFRAEYRFIAKDGHIVWVREEATPVVDHEGYIRHWQGVRFDVTAEKEHESRLRAAEERYRLVVEELPAIAYVDERRPGESRTWPCIYVSPQVETILGFTPDEWMNGPESWDDLLHPDDRARAAESDEAHYERGEPVDVELRVRGRDGRYRWIRDQAVIVRDESGQARWSQGIWVDVTDRKHAEEALAEAEARYRGIVEHVPAAIYLDATDESMETVYVSPQILALTGYTPEEWIDRPGLWVEVMDPDDRDETVPSYLAAIADRRPWTGEYRMRRPDGRTVWIHDEITYVSGGEGEPDLVQGVLFDVTERRLAEQALRDSEQREREAAERLRALDEMKNTFLAAVSHELRSPLTSILGLALTLERAPEIADEDRADLLVRLAANARKLDRLLKDLLDIDRLNRGIVEPQYRVTDIGALARRTIEHLDQLAGRDITVEAEPIVLGIDPPKIERIIENLVMNAARHTDGGRRIWLRVMPHEDGALIVVDDEGPGVPSGLHEVIFEPFRQGPTPSAHSPGTGIGLSLVARFAELHEGRAWVQEREGGGASFRVYIPGHEPGEATSKPGTHLTLAAG